MQLRRTIVLAAIAAALTSPVARGQAVQLPSMSVFGVDTTVVVPDSGGAFLGGDRRASYGVNSFGGLPPNRGFGVNRQATGAQVTATIHDPRAAEAALVGPSLRMGHANAPADGRLRIGAAQAATDVRLGSVAELEQRRMRQAVDQQRDAQALLAKAREARRAGKSAVAAIYLRSASRRATGRLRSQIDAELAELTAAPTATRAASASPRAARAN